MRTMLVCATATLLGGLAACSTGEAMNERQVRTRCAEALVGLSNSETPGLRRRMTLTGVDHDARTDEWKCTFGGSGGGEIAIRLSSVGGTYALAR